MSGTSSEAPKKKPQPRKASSSAPAKAASKTAAPAVAKPNGAPRRSGNGAPRAKSGGRRLAIPEAQVQDGENVSSYQVFFRTMGSCAFSTIVHMGVLLIMALWVLPMVLDVPTDLSAVQERDQ